MGHAAGWLPASLSVGVLIQHAIAVEGRSDPRVYRVTRWQLQELSVVVYGKDKAACLRSLGCDEDAATMVARMNAASGGVGRAAVRNNLRLDEWERWPVPAAVRLAEKLGVDDAELCELLDQEVRRRCERFVADLGACA